MAGEDLKRHFDDMAAAAAKAAKNLNTTAEQLSNKGVDKLTDSVKKYLKTANILNDTQLDQIKTFQELDDTIKAFDNQIDKLIDTEKELEKNYQKRMREAQNSAKIQEKITAQHLEETEVIRNNIKQKIEESKKLKEYIESQGRVIKSTDALRKAQEDLGKSVKGQIAQYISVGYAVSKFTEGLKESYQGMHDLSQKGLLGSLSSITVASKKLLMTTMQFSEVVQKNRDLVNAYGGGAAGVARLGEQIGKVTKDLKFLGQDAGKGAARLVEMSKAAGLNVTHGQAYTDSMDATTTQYKKFAALWGDSADQYAALMEAQYEEESTRNRLNTLNKQQLSVALAEIRARTENLKMLGLSNEQIADFNKRTEEMNNPRKSGQIAKRLKEGTATKNSLQMMMNTVDPTSEEGKNLAKHKSTLDQYANMASSGVSPDKLKKFQTENAAAFKALADSRTWIDNNLDQYQRESHLRMADRGGQTLDNATAFGKSVSTADAQGKSLLSQSETQLAATIQNNIKSLEGIDPVLGDVGTKFQWLAEKLGLLQSIWNDGFMKPLIGIGVAALALAGGFGFLAKATAAVIRMFGMLAAKGGLSGAADLPGGSGKGGKGGKGGRGGKLATAGKLMKGAGIAGVALDVGMGINDLANGQAQEEMSGLDYLSPMRWGMYAGDKINKGVEAISGGSIGTNLYDAFHKSPNVTAPVKSNAKPAGGGRGSINPSMPASNQTPASMKQSKSTSVANDRKVALERALDSKGITDPKERAAFLAQMDHETGGFKHMKELGNDAYFSKYDGRKSLGNTQDGDGAKFKGRGYIQLTGRANYEKYGKMIGVDLINQPDLAADPDIASKIAIAYWNDRKVKGKSLGEHAREGNFDVVTKGINGGYNGKADRDKKYAKYLSEGTNSGMSTNPTLASIVPSSTSASIGTPNFVNGVQKPIGAANLDASAIPTTAPVVPSEDPNVALMKKQNALLEQISTNTRNGPGKSNGYQRDSATVAPHATA